MRKIHCIAATLFFLLPVSTLQAQKAKRPEVPITNVSGVQLRQSPSLKAKEMGELGVRDGVKVIKKAVSDSRNGANELWAFVILVRSMQRGSQYNQQRGWVLDKDLGYKNRFKKITSWKEELTSGELSNYKFTMEVNRDGSFVHKYAPCVSCGEKPDCNKGERKVGSECVSRGHLYRYGNFV
jgi:hypothetical protein